VPRDATRPLRPLYEHLVKTSEAYAVTSPPFVLALTALAWVVLLVAVIAGVDVGLPLGVTSVVAVVLAVVHVTRKEERRIEHLAKPELTVGAGLWRSDGRRGGLVRVSEGQDRGSG
jgi:hypothetical protein